MGFRKDTLMSELRVMLEKEKEMRDLYMVILKDLEDPSLHEKIRVLKEEEERHMGYVEIIMSLFEDEVEEKTVKMAEKIIATFPSNERHFEPD